LGHLKKKRRDRAVALPNWLAPEVISESEYTEKSDVYAFGIIMWELICRKHPFHEYSFLNEIEAAILEGKRPVFPPDCPKSWIELTKTMLER